MSDTAPAILADDMPESLAEVVAAIGLASTLQLVEHFGGIRLYVPKPDFITESHRIARTIGVAPAKKLAALWGGEFMALPRAEKARRLARNRALLRDYESMSAPQCARKYQLTARTVHLIVSARRSRKKQREHSRPEISTSARRPQRGA